MINPEPLDPVGMSSLVVASILKTTMSPVLCNFVLFELKVIEAIFENVPEDSVVLPFYAVGTIILT